MIMCEHAKMNALTLEEILLDPITELLMARDNVQKDHVRDLMARLKQVKQADLNRAAGADKVPLLMAG
ncbi:MAG: hypothetical protein WBQ60_12620 [Asticcacaulis sp.]